MVITHTRSGRAVYGPVRFKDSIAQYFDGTRHKEEGYDSCDEIRDSTDALREEAALPDEPCDGDDPDWDQVESEESEGGESSDGGDDESESEAEALETDEEGTPAPAAEQ